ncbi:MAG: hypothetical protein ACYDDF_11960 [Thermoplasmatota archaeon]
MLPELRRFIGTKCPACARDILQSAPPVARMPPGDYLFCPACDTRQTLGDLLHGGAGAVKGSVFGRLFGKANRA